MTQPPEQHRNAAATRGGHTTRGTDEERLAEDHGRPDPVKAAAHGDHLEFLQNGGNSPGRGPKSPGSPKSSS